MTTLADFRARLRKDLHDEDAANYRWTDSILDRHIAKAVQEFSLAIPLQQKSTLQTVANSREISLSSLSGLVNIEAVEYPTAKYPPVYVRFSLWGTTLTLLVDSAPSAVKDVFVFWNKTHTVNGTPASSTIPAQYEDLINMGASGYAAVEWASYATNRVNVGGGWTWKNYLSWGNERLARFHKQLAYFSHKNRVIGRVLYAPARPSESQTSDQGP